MKRTPVLIVFAAIIAVVSMLSCDAMFSNNLFAGMTHKTITADSVAGMSPSEIEELLDSEYNMDQVADDPELKAQLLEQLEGEYTADPGTAEGQTAAILAAEISIQTVPDAAQLAAGAVGLIMDIPETLDIEWLSDAISGILPQDIKDSFTNGSAAAPQGFIDAISAFLEANAAYEALNAGVGTDGVYDADVTAEEATEIAVNALIAGMLGLITGPEPDNTAFASSADVAQALWTAMLNPSAADSVIGIDEDMLNKFTNPANSPVGNLLTAAGLTDL